MKVIEVIPSRRWRNSRTGRAASVYGAVPWTTEAGKADWSIECSGWTWRMSNGTIGLGRKPAETHEEAEEIATRINARCNQ